MDNIDPGNKQIKPINKYKIILLVFLGVTLAALTIYTLIKPYTNAKAPVQIQYQTSIAHIVNEIDFVFLENNELYKETKELQPVQITSTNNTITSFAVDKIKKIVYFVTNNPGNTIYSCQLITARYSTPCSPTNVYTENSNDIISNLAISPNGQFLSYDLTIYTDPSRQSFNTNMHILNLTSDETIIYSETDYSGEGIPRYFNSRWLNDNFFTYSSGMDGIKLDYGQFLGSLSYQDSNLGDDGTHYIYNMSNFGTRNGDDKSEIINIQVLAIDSTSATILVFDNYDNKGFLSTVPLNFLNQDVISDITDIQNASTKTYDLKSDLPDYSIDNWNVQQGFQDGNNYEIITCDIVESHKCTLEEVNGNLSESKVYTAKLDTVSQEIPNGPNIEGYNFSNGMYLLYNLVNENTSGSEEMFLIDPFSNSTYSSLINGSEEMSLY